MNTNLRLDHLYEDLGDSCICGALPGSTQACRGKFRTKRRKNKTPNKNATDGLREAISALQDGFSQLSVETRRLTATRVANLAMCNDCLKADRVPQVVNDLVQGFERYVFESRGGGGKDSPQPTLVRRCYTWIEGYVKMGLTSTYYTKTSEQSRGPASELKVVSDALSETSSAGPPPYSSHEIRRRVTRSASENMRVLNEIARSWGPVTQDSEVSTPSVESVKTVISQAPIVRGRSRAGEGDAIVNLQEVLQGKVRQDSPLEDRIQRLEKWATVCLYVGGGLIILLAVVTMAWAVLHLRAWTDAGTRLKIVALSLWQVVVGLWDRCSGRVYKLASALRQAWDD